MYLGIYHDHTTYKVKITNNSRPAQKTRVLKNGKTVVTWSVMQKLAKAI